MSDWQIKFENIDEIFQVNEDDTIKVVNLDDLENILSNYYTEVSQNNCGELLTSDLKKEIEYGFLKILDRYLIEGYGPFNWKVSVENIGKGLEVTIIGDPLKIIMDPDVSQVIEEVDNG